MVLSRIIHIITVNWNTTHTHTHSLAELWLYTQVCICKYRNTTSTTRAIYHYKIYSFTYILYRRKALCTMVHVQICHRVARIHNIPFYIMSTVRFVGSPFTIHTAARTHTHTQTNANVRHIGNTYAASKIIVCACVFVGCISTVRMK